MNSVRIAFLFALFVAMLVTCYCCGRRPPQVYITNKAVDPPVSAVLRQNGLSHLTAEMDFQIDNPSSSRDRYILGQLRGKNLNRLANAFQGVSVSNV